MPIYAYKCESCGYAKDVLQKMSDPQLTDCPQCAASAFKKQLTAAGFQLKGSGWYVTDFRGGDNGAQAAKPVDGVAPEAGGSGNQAAVGGEAPAGTGAAVSSDVAASKPATAAPAGKSSSASVAPSASSSPVAKAG